MTNRTSLLRALVHRAVSHCRDRSMNVALTAFLAIALSTVPLHANVVPPGGTVSPDVFPDNVPVQLLASLSGTYTFGSGQDLISGTYHEFVFDLPSDPTCPTCLIFDWHVTLNGLLTAGVNDILLGHFSSFTTDVGYVQGTGGCQGCIGYTGGDGIPTAVIRSPNGNRIHFAFHSLNSLVGPGGTTADLIIVTDATAFNQQGVLFIGGGRNNPAEYQVDAGVFQPTTAPEPASLALLTAGLPALFCLRRRRK